jgi:hypothetical protein
MSQKRRTTSLAVKGLWSRLTELTIIEMAVVAERFPLRIQPNFDGSSTTDLERRIGGVLNYLPLVTTSDMDLNWEVLRFARCLGQP